MRGQEPEVHLWGRQVVVTVKNATGRPVGQMLLEPLDALSLAANLTGAVHQVLTQGPSRSEALRELIGEAAPTGERFELLELDEAPG